jgi:hypothetical protein
MRHILGVLLFTASCLAATVEQVVDYDGAEVTGHLRDARKSSFAIRIHDAPYSTKLAAGIRSWWGVDGGIPNRVTTELAIRIGRAEVTIPRHAYSDLGDPIIPYGVSLMQDRKYTYVYLRGGDGAGSYIAKFFIRAGRLTRREVVPGEFPQSKPGVMTFDK